MTRGSKFAQRPGIEASILTPDFLYKILLTNEQFAKAFKRVPIGQFEVEGVGMKSIFPKITTGSESHFRAKLSSNCMWKEGSGLIVRLLLLCWCTIWGLSTKESPDYFVPTRKGRRVGNLQIDKPMVKTASHTFTELCGASSVIGDLRVVEAYIDS